ncbi:unnamed protein product [Ranitomeya imitator]|uniref:Uncharacterized protein n=1 Tax=Ranitomeya imitator TaxID=111125 RepID=A0ABN9LWX1_9NEOB|nr:unnamed protein product [Ranitomeya imitator]
MFSICMLVLTWIIMLPGILYAQKPVPLIAGYTGQSGGSGSSNTSQASQSPTSSRGTPGAEPSTSWSL